MSDRGNIAKKFVNNLINIGEKRRCCHAKYRQKIGGFTPPCQSLSNPLTLLTLISVSPLVIGARVQKSLSDAESVYDYQSVI